MFAKICAFFMTLFASLMAAVSPLPEVDGIPVQADPAFDTTLRFVVSSDSHVKKYGDIGCERIMKMIQTGYNAAAADEKHPTLDAAVLAGDITNTGWPHTFWSVGAAIKNVLKDETDMLAVAAKNHDSYLGRISRAYASGLSGDPADFHKVINGYHFIGISAGQFSVIHYTDLQLKWLDKQLAEAVADDPAKPVFVFQHEHIYDTVYGSYPEDTWGVEFFTDILSKYPQVIDISGHSHYPANDPRAIWQGAFTAINDGGLAYYEFTIDGAKSQHPESSDNMAHCLLVEVDSSERVKVSVCDLNAGKVLAEYLIDNVIEPVKTKYAPATRKAQANAPVFTAEPSCEVNGSTAVITVPAAKAAEDDVVFIYRAIITDANGNTVKEYKKLGQYYKGIEDGTLTFTHTFEAPGEYTVTCIAEDAWGLKTEVAMNLTAGS